MVQPIPLLGAPFVETQTGRITRAWYRVILDLFQFVPAQPGVMGQVLRTNGVVGGTFWDFQFHGTLVGLANSTQALPSATPTVVAWDSTDWDTDGYWSGGAPTVLTIPVGVTQVALRAGAKVMGTTTALLIELLRNGSAGTNGLGAFSSAGGVDQVAVVAGTCVVAADDTIGVRVTATGAGLTLGQFATFLELEVVA